MLKYVEIFRGRRFGSLYTIGALVLPVVVAVLSFLYSVSATYATIVVFSSALIIAGLVIKHRYGYVLSLLSAITAVIIVASELTLRTPAVMSVLTASALGTLTASVIMLFALLTPVDTVVAVDDNTAVDSDNNTDDDNADNNSGTDDTAVDTDNIVNTDVDSGETHVDNIETAVENNSTNAVIVGNNTSTNVDTPRRRRTRL